MAIIAVLGSVFFMLIKKPEQYKVQEQEQKDLKEELEGGEGLNKTVIELAIRNLTPTINPEEVE